MTKKFFNRIIVTLGLFFLATNVHAYQLSPLNATYYPSGVESVKTYKLTNDSDFPIAIEISANKRYIDLNGNEYTEPAMQYFSIQPSKMIIKPATTQIVRVQYRGPKTVTKEMAFRIVSEQIPYSRGASVTSEGQMINFLFVYSTAAYVAPSKVIERVEGYASKVDDRLVITLKNTGSVHQILNSLGVTLKGDDGSSYTLSDEDVSSVEGVNLLTDSSVCISLEIPKEIEKASSFTVQIKYDYSYSK